MRRTPLTEVSVSDDYISGPLPILREEGGRGTKMGRSTPVLTSFSVCVFSNVYMLSLFRMGCFSLGTLRDLGSRVLQFESSLKSRALQNILHVAGRATKSHEHDCSRKSYQVT